MRLARFLLFPILFRSRQRFVPLLTVVAFTGIALSVFALLVVMGVMEGFEKELTNRFVKWNSHLRVTGLVLESPHALQLEEWLKNQKEVSRSEIFVEGEAIGATHLEGNQRTKGVRVRGVPGEKVRVGEDFVRDLDLIPGVQDTMTLLHPFGEVGPTGDFVPRQMQVKVDEYFHTGLYDWDRYMVLVPLRLAKTLLREYASPGIEIWLNSFDDLDRFAKKLKEEIPSGAAVATFAEQNSRLFSALRLERLAMGGLLLLFALIASISFISLLYLLMTSKRRDWAILRSLGLSARQACRLFWSLGLVLGSSAMLCGVFLGGVALVLLSRFPVPLPAVYYLDFLPVSLRPETIFFFLVIGLGMVLLASAYPVRMTSRRNLLTLLREE